MNTEAKLYELGTGFARRNNLLIYFVGVQLAETEKAVYLYGHGTTESRRTGRCCVCGRGLTHPVSVELGIGPECGGHYHNWALIGGYTPENLDRLKGALVDVKVDSWIPKSQILSTQPSQETVIVPPEHSMLKRMEDSKQQNREASMAENKYGDRVIKICFPYSYDLLVKVRSIPGRMYHSDTKCWSAPLIVETIESLLEWGFTLDDLLLNFLEKVRNRKREIVSIQGIPGLRGVLLPFQREGVAFIEQHNGRVLLADEMGLGKTVQALAWLQLHPELRPAVIVVPASLKLNWEREARRWMSNPEVEVLSGTWAWKPSGKILVVNYDVLSDWVDRLKELEPLVLIFDEVHYIKTKSAQRTKAAKQLNKGIPYLLGLSGTPIVNRPIEGFTFIKMCAPDLFPNEWTYYQRYCKARYNGYGWDFSGADHTDELHKLLIDSIMLRRLKKDVLKDLPDKVRSFVPIELVNSKEYFEAESNFVDYIRKTKGREAAIKASSAEALASIEGLKQLAVTGKLNSVISWIKDFLDIDGKLVVFATHRFVIDRLMEEFKDIAVKVDGSVTGEDRQAAVDKFQTQEHIRLFIGNIKAAGVGLTLTAASNVAFIELPWTPGDLIQAEDRCHRIGQKDSVNIYYLLALHTIEERIAKLLDSKRKILDSVLDGIVTEEESLLTALINEYLKD